MRDNLHSSTVTSLTYHRLEARLYQVVCLFPGRRRYTTQCRSLIDVITSTQYGMILYQVYHDTMVIAKSWQISRCYYRCKEFHFKQPTKTLEWYLPDKLYTRWIRKKSHRIRRKTSDSSPSPRFVSRTSAP